MSAISRLSSIYLKSVLRDIFQSAGLSSKTTDGQSVGSTSTVSQADNHQLSPLARLLSTPQKLQQSDPEKYKEVTQQIATNLQAAAKTVQADGNTTAATQLTRLASDFTDASKTGQFTERSGPGASGRRPSPPGLEFYERRCLEHHPKPVSGRVAGQSNRQRRDEPGVGDHEHAVERWVELLEQLKL